MRKDILTDIAESKDLTNIIILTYNIDLIFLQSLVIPKLKKTGHPIVTVFADGKCANEAYNRHGQFIDGIGKRFRVVPVNMENQFSFHPKCILLSSRKKGVLFVGSGNLSFGGWKENAEVWVRYDSEDDGLQPFVEFKEYLRNVLDLVPLNKSIEAEVNEAFDGNNHEWIHTETINSEGKSLIGKCGVGESLVSQMAMVVGDDPVDELTLCSPYFDERGEMVTKLKNHFHAVSTHALIQKKKSGVTKNTADKISSQVELRTVDFKRSTNISSFLHAKFYAASNNQSTNIFLGSANCSLAALEIPGRKGNAELLAVMKMNRSDYEKQFLDELNFLSDDPELSDEQIPDRKSEIEEYIRILGARFDNGILEIAVKHSPGVMITSCKLDDQEVPCKLDNDNSIIINSKTAPQTIIVFGKQGNNMVESARGWVDSEPELRSTSYQRRLADAISKRVTPAEWNITVWGDILKLLYENLEYMPKRSTVFKPQGASESSSNVEEIQFTTSDVFTDHYGLPGGTFSGLPRDEDGKIIGLQQLLLQWFGISVSTDDASLEVKSEREMESTETALNEKETDIFVEDLNGTRPSYKGKDNDERERKRAHRLINKIIGLFTQDQFLLNRSPEHLGLDLSLLFTLIRKGLNNNYIEYESFLDLTHQIWSKLFFTLGKDIDGVDEPMGWLEFRYRKVENKDEFKHRLSTIDLAVILSAWACCIRPVPELPEEAFFELACIESIARLDWLWRADIPEEIAPRLKKLLVSIGDIQVDDDTKWNEIRSRWKEVIQQGYAFKELRELLLKIDVDDASTIKTKDIVQRGEMLWQSSRGLCIATETVKKSSNISTKLLCLQSTKRYMDFSSQFLIPIGDILNATDHQIIKALDPKIRDVVGNFTSKCSKIFEKSIIG